MNTHKFLFRIIPTCLLLASCFFSPNFAKAQSASGVSSDGRDFYIGFVYPSFNKANTSSAGRNVAGFFSVHALISSYEGNNKVTIAYFDPQSGQETTTSTLTVGARNAVQVQLNLTMMKMDEPGDIPQYRACHITSQNPVNIQYFSTGACSGGSYLALATPALGKNYVVPSYYDNPGAGAATNAGSTGENAGGFFLLVAAFDSTHIIISPNETTAGGHQGKNSGNGSDGQEHPYSILLRRGQCYWVKGKGADGSNDMSGTVVVSDKPIAMLAGHEDAFIGDVGARYVDARDFMIEQAIPAEFFDTTGYVSIPLVDAAPLDETSPGYGENYRVYTDQPTSSIVMNNCSGSNILFSAQKLGYPTPERSNVGCPMEFHSIDGHKFGVMMYDLRGQGTTAPYPSESMMTIIPMSSWKTSYLFYVAANTFEVLQNYYINVIALRTDLDGGFIKFGFNGSSTLTNVTTGFSSKGSFPNIPNHPELKGARYVVHPGAYYLTNVRDAILHPLTDTGGTYHGTPEEVNADTTYLHGAFMVYHYGMRALDPDRDLGDFCGDDFFFSYANPVGASLSSGDPAKLSIVIDSQCGKWNLCVHDTKAKDPGIRSITLLNDSTGIQFSPGKKSVNCKLDATIDPKNFGEVELPGTDSVVCFSVSADNPFLPSYGAVMITDNAGKKQVVEFQNASKKLSISPNSTPIDFGVHGYSSDTCINIVIKNTADLVSPPRLIRSVELIGSNLFSIANVQPTLPFTIGSNDSLLVRVCFTGSDTTVVIDSLKFGIDCFDQPIVLQAQGTAPIISANDLDFGAVDTGSTICKNDTIRNIGAAAFTLSKNFILHDAKHFIINDAARLPLIIPAGGFVILSVCYTPGLEADTTRIDWATNVKDHTQKDFSILTGRGAVPLLNWNVPSFAYSTDTVTAVVKRFYLLNHGVRDANVDVVKIIGVDSAQFTIVADQLGFIPLKLFPLHVGDSIWVDIRFMPLLSGIPPARYANRHAQAVALAAGEKTAVLDLSATFATSGVSQASPPMKFSINPNPANGSSIILSFDRTSENAEISIFDILGREMYKRKLSSSLNQLEIPISALYNGIYYARVMEDGKIVTQKFEVAR